MKITHLTRIGLILPGDQTLIDKTVITWMKYWQKIICEDTGDTIGIVCVDCFEKTKQFYRKGEYVDMENIAENMLLTCQCCDKLVGEDYSVCGECGEIYPKGQDYRVDSLMKCLCCAYGI